VFNNTGIVDKSLKDKYSPEGNKQYPSLILGHLAPETVVVVQVSSSPYSMISRKISRDKQQ
jgi:hypothetical protein